MILMAYITDVRAAAKRVADVLLVRIDSVWGTL